MNSIITLENSHLRVQVASCGAELQSMVSKSTGKENLWHGDDRIWGDRAPWLFPIIGQLRGGTFAYKGEKYAMPMHGFASHANFEVEACSGTEATFVLRASEETLKVYPWRFELKIIYTLCDAQLDIRCSVRCEDQEEMYFSFGAHPGFVCSPGDKLIFEGAKELACCRLDLGTHLLKPESVAVDETIALQEALFEEDAMLLRAPECESATLMRKDGTGVRFKFGRVSWVGVWTRAHGGLPYICVEPWFGVDDPVDADGDIEKKLDIVRLPAGEVFTMNLNIKPF